MSASLSESIPGDRSLVDVLTFGERLLISRRRRGLTASSVAAELGVSPNTVTSWEADRTRPAFYHRRRLRELVGDAGLDLADQ